MIDRQTGKREYYVIQGANGQYHEADGSITRPFPSLDAALAAVGKQSPGDAASCEEDTRHIELIFLDRPGAAGRVKPTPRYQYYIDPRGGDRHGDGTELTPWPDMETAVAGIASRHQMGQWQPRPGERLRVSYREVFTATRLEKRRQTTETIAQYAFLTMALLLVLPVMVILGHLLVQAWPALSWGFLLDNPQLRMTAGGIWAPLVGTFFLVLGSLLIAAPTGILAGVYLNEYAGNNWLTRLIHLAVVNLAGVPSIVHGLFGVGAFVYFAGMGRSLLAASCTVAVMTLPVIIASTKEALAAVPMAFREACWNMGATRWQTIRTIVLPNSISGILTGVILQVARAAGETAPILFTGAVFFVPIANAGVESVLPYGPSSRFMALSYHLWTVSTQVQDVPDGIQYGTAVVLIGLVLFVNSLSIGLRIYLRSRKKW
jgi:phosphate transport system permease protein